MTRSFMFVSPVFTKGCRLCEASRKGMAKIMGKGTKSSGQKAPGGNTVAVCTAIAKPVADELGLTLWDVRFVKEGATWYLRYIIDKEEGVTIDDCANLSRRINPLLDEADPIDQAYCLEVCSPGICRELTRPEHFAAFEGWPVAVRLYRPVEGEREFAGYLREFADGQITIELEDGSLRSFEKKEVSLVHVIDDGDFEDIPDEEAADTPS